MRLVHSLSILLLPVWFDHSDNSSKPLFHFIYLFIYFTTVCHK